MINFAKWLLNTWKSKSIIIQDWDFERDGIERPTSSKGHHYSTARDLQGRIIRD